MKNQLRKRTLTLMLLTLLFLLTACASKQQKESNVESTSPIESSTEIIVEETEITTLMETTVEPKTETSVIAETSEEAPEAIIYEGIDIESDLPAIEWMDTLYGVIEEPKILILKTILIKK